MSDADFVKERDAALLSLDRKKIVAYMEKYGSPIPPESIFWHSVHKARTAATSLPMSARANSKFWLAQRGMRSMDDGDVPWVESDTEAGIQTNDR